MSTFTELKKELSECERQIIAVRLKSEEKVQKENERCAQVEKTRDDTIEAHNKKVAEMHEEYEQQINNVKLRAEARVNQLAKERQQAEDRARAATEKAEEAEQRVRELEGVLHELRQTLDEKMLEEEERTKQVVQTANLEVNQRLEDASHCIRDTARYASEIQNGVVNSIEVMHDEHKARSRDTELASTQRSRYKELHDAAINHSTRDISHNEFAGIRSELVQGWYDDWVSTTTSAGQRALWTDNLRLEGSAEDPLRPADPTSPRAVERARQHTMERQRLAQEGLLQLTAP
mmetsp:Transcript_137199/g.382688  ORF Transcript_137199/g.382688 Transcript_137199/m.382688 type:complete len:291 (+) Transcript_137199:73-945(+)|eukprot:CAMPEP_0179053550 /NCGR_PEP_ID=MMETSP0796-20121207/22331_1 /TAXON_ID=73915 /ORGANISM="Pyrodinium bahamense, Strain pbaha01" /LENGTH=290 /DNA_ID=CAMNT_0020750151 /DNA_START=70 /DNA_END=942 /DNA_ORIENTATION=+